MTRMVGPHRALLGDQASSCSASTAGTSVPRSALASPRRSWTIVFRLGLVDGTRTRSPSKNGSSDRAWLSSSPTLQNTWQPASGASATATRTSADLPIPGSPSMRTEPPRQFSYQPGQQRYLTVAADRAANCMEQTSLPEYLLNKQTYSDTNSVKRVFAMLLMRRPVGLMKLSRQLASHDSPTFSRFITIPF